MAEGFAVVDKPAGVTSHDVVARARKVLSERRVGHAGTLDPDATGILLLGVGRVTRLLRFLTALPKTYTGEVVFGVETSTLDASGEVVATHEMRPQPEAVQAAAVTLTGPIMQVPPMVSALKVRWTAAARARARGHRGRARGPAGHRPSLRRGADERCARLCDHGAVLIGHLCPVPRCRPRARPRRGRPPARADGGPPSAPSLRLTRHRSKMSCSRPRQSRCATTRGSRRALRSLPRSRTARP